jgi:DNA-nicking Smr family endonuclease
MKRFNSIYHLLGDLPQQIKVFSDKYENEIQTPKNNTSIPTDSVSSCTDVFQEAMKGVRQIDQNKGRIPIKSSKKKRSSGICDRDLTMGHVFTENYSITVRHLPEYMEGFVDGLNPEIIEKLRNEEYSIQQVLDLHGLSSEDAASVFASFMNEAIHKNIHCVKVIHGRGLKSKNGPILKEKLKEWLIRAINRKWVIAFCSSKMAHGGPGATLILLKNRPHKERIHIIG